MVINNMEIHTSHVTFPLKGKSKIPAVKEWQKLLGTPFCYAKKDCNWGIICGERNLIAVVDVDVKHGTQKEADLFIKKYNLKSLSSFYVETPSGGYHFYFKWRKGIKSISPSINGKNFVDILSCNRFAVMFGSTINDKEYKIIKGDDLSSLTDYPKKLEDDLLEYSKKVKKMKQAVSASITALYLPVSTEVISEDDKTILCKMLMSTKMVSFNIRFFQFWFHITTVLKRYNLKKFWDDWSKMGSPESYKKEENEQIWESIDLSKSTVDKYYVQYLYVSLANGNTHQFNGPTFVKIMEPPNVTKINEKYLVTSEGKVNETILNIYKEHKILVIKSRMGTGKTTLMMKLHKDHGFYRSPFLSCGNLISLLKNQYTNFSKHGAIGEKVSYKFYKTDRFKPEDNLFICLNSLGRLDENYTNRTLYLDEFSVLLQSLSSNSTIHNSREVLNRLKFLIKTAHRVVITDADVNDACFNFLRMIGEDFQFIQNDYVEKQEQVKHYAMSEASAFWDRVKEKREEQIIFCSDSKEIIDEAEKVFLLLGFEQRHILKITSETSSDTTVFDCENWKSKKVILYSPSVTIGCDYVPKSPCTVFCYSHGNSINPFVITQQIFRCRKIKEIISHCAKKSKDTKYFSLSDIETSKKDFESMRKSDMKAVESWMFLDEEDFLDDESIFCYISNYYTLMDHMTKCDFRKYLREGIEDKGIETIDVTTGAIEGKNEMLTIISKELKEERKEKEKDFIEKCCDMIQTKSPEIEVSKDPAVLRCVYLNIHNNTEDMVKFGHIAYDDRKFSEHFVYLALKKVVDKEWTNEKYFEKLSRNNFDRVLKSKYGELEILRRWTSGDRSEELINLIHTKFRIKYTENKVQEFTAKLCNHIAPEFYKSHKPTSGNRARTYLLNSELQSFHADLLEKRKRKVNDLTLDVFDLV